MTMSPADLLVHLHREAASIAQAVQLSGAEGSSRAVPTCPGWTLRDLIVHTGVVHRWALRRTTGAPREDVPEDLADDQLVPWFADGVRRLHAALSAADPDQPCKGFEDEVTVRFWIRRQAHELAMHRVDAQLAVLSRAEPVAGDLAVDGIAEVLEVFAPRQVALGHSPPPRGVRLVWHDTGAAGEALLPGPDPITVSGTASDLLCALWGRPGQVSASDEQAWRQVLSTGLTP